MDKKPLFSAVKMIFAGETVFTAIQTVLDQKLLFSAEKKVSGGETVFTAVNTVLFYCRYCHYIVILGINVQGFYTT